MNEYTFAAQSYNKGYKDGKTAAINQLLTDLEFEIKEHSVHWTYQSRAGLLERIAAFRKQYLEN